MAQSNDKKHKKLHIELLRFIFIFGVIYVHIDTYPKVDIGWKTYLEYALFFPAKLAVPIFFMITGALLLPKEESFRDFLSKRVPRAVGFMMIYFAIQVTYIIFKGAYFTPYTFCVTFIRFLLNDYFLSPVGWFFYTYFSLILLLPFIRILAKYLSNQSFYYLFFLQFIFCAAIPVIYTLLFHKKGIFYTSGCTTDAAYSIVYGIFYMLLGYFLERRAQHINLRTIFRLSPFIAVSFVSICALHVHFNTGSDNNFINLLGFQPIFTAFIYITAKSFFRYHQLPSILNRFIITLGGAAFTVMLTENIFRNLLSTYFASSLGAAHHISLNLSFCVVTCLCGLAIGVVLKKVPILNKVI